MSDSVSSGLVSRYAKAFFELAKEQRALDSIETELHKLSASLSSSSDAVRLLHNPLVSKELQQKNIVAVLTQLKMPALVINLGGLLAKNGRLALLLPVIDCFMTMLSEERGEITVEVTSVRALDEKERALVLSSLKEALGHDIRMKTLVDTSILGGLIVKIGSKMLDSSLASKLERLKIMAIQAVSVI